MMFRTHFASGVLLGLAVDAVAAAVGHPLPFAEAVLFPPACGYLSAIPDVDHHNAWIRHAVPPARWLYLLIRLLLTIRVGCERADYWMGHRRITHTIDFAFTLGALVELPLAVWQGVGWWLLTGPAITAGCLAHRAGDRLTKSGVPAWSWRLDDVRPGFHWLRTGHWGEHLFVYVQYAAIAGVVWVLAGLPDPAVLGSGWHALLATVAP